jgi:hypothetical protein
MAISLDLYYISGTFKDVVVLDTVDTLIRHT